MPALILMYHDVFDDVTGVPPGHMPYVLKPAVFASQMRAIADAAVPVLTVTAWCELPRPSRALVVTFDDGHVSNHDVALPVLIEHRLKATFFVTAGAIGAGTTMGWSQLRVLHAAGMEIGSHTLTHRPPSMLDDDALRHELIESRRILEDGLGAPVTSISSPTGFFNPRMRRIAREAGYRGLCFGSAGLAADDGDLFSLKRVAVKRSMRCDRFEALLRFDVATLRRIRLRQVVRDVARSALGLDVYLRIRRLLLPSAFAR